MQKQLIITQNEEEKLRARMKLPFEVRFRLLINLIKADRMLNPDPKPKNRIVFKKKK